MIRFTSWFSEWLFRKALLLLLLGLILCATAPNASAQTVWELMPYRVRLFVALEPTPDLTPELASSLKQGLLDRVGAVIGSSWDVTLDEPAPPLRHRMLGSLDTLTFEDLSKDTVDFDKVLFVAIVREGSGYEVLSRELDVRTRIFSPILRRPVWQLAKLRDTALRAMIDVFTPLAQVVKTEKRSIEPPPGVAERDWIKSRTVVVLRLRAGELAPRDPAVRRVQSGDTFQPFIRYDDRQGNLRKIIPIVWTFLVVDRCDSEAFETTCYSAMSSPMSGRYRGRVEQLALAVRPLGETTRVFIRGRVEPKPRLAGYPIFDHKLGGLKESHLLDRTDVDGSIVVDRKGGPLRLLDVKSGKATLARLPVMPGLVPEVEAEVRNDDQRLEAEGFLEGIQNRFVDLVVLHQILIRRGNKYIEDGKLDKAEKVVEQLRDMPTRADLIREVNTRQERIVTEDEWTKKKVQDHFDDTRKLLKKYLEPGPIEALARDVAAARRGEKRPPAPKQ